MIALFLDTETTGLDPLTKRVVQYAIVVYDIFKKKMIDYRSWLVYEEGFEIDQERVHGWDLETLKRYGKKPFDVLWDIQHFTSTYSPRFVLAHNGINFDRNFLKAEADRATAEQAKNYPLEAFVPNWFILLNLPWIDTLHHKDYPGCPSKNLLTLAAHHGFLNPFPHNALFDCVTLAKIVEQNNIFEYILNAAEEKFVVSAGGLPKFDYATYKVVNQKLKDLGFKFQEYQGHFYEKTWFQVIPASKLSILTETCRDFCTPSVVKVIPPPDEVKALARELWYGETRLGTPDRNP